MNKLSKQGWMAMLVLWLAAATCNMPAGAPQNIVETALPTQDVAATAAALALTAQLSLAPSPTAGAVAPAQPAATQCYAMATANTDVNVRTGPSTAYDIIGYLPTGGTAPIAGRNDVNTWWYIDFAAGPGGHAWVAGSVTTATCLPSVVQVVAAPPLPTAEPTTEEEEPPPAEPAEPAAKPDLIVSEFTISPATPVMGQNAHVRIGAYNQGNAASGQYVVLWYGLSTFANPSCSWTVNHSNAHGGRILECDFVFNSWYPINKTSLVIVDANSQVDESNEGNNEGTISPFGVTQP